MTTFLVILCILGYFAGGAVSYVLASISAPKENPFTWNGDEPSALVLWPVTLPIFVAIGINRRITIHRIQALVAQKRQQQLADLEYQAEEKRIKQGMQELDKFLE
jgi:hypothetical protein